MGPYFWVGVYFGKYGHWLSITLFYIFIWKSVLKKLRAIMNSNFDTAAGLLLRNSILLALLSNTVEWLSFIYWWWRSKIVPRIYRDWQCAQETRSTQQASAGNDFRLILDSRAGRISKSNRRKKVKQNKNKNHSRFRQFSERFFEKGIMRVQKASI